jgi:tetratricopeptide (TPR) repeat protein
MKVAVYTIALNEEKFVAPWVTSSSEADYQLIVDTGSTDATVAEAEAYGVNVQSITVKPWRFDMARNVALALLPADIDYCIALDMDEVLLPGWREALEKAHEAGWTRPRYQYTWNWNEDGTPGLTYGGDKIHSRWGYRWKHPVHEVCMRYGTEPETIGWIDLEIHHHADNTKSRGQYFPLLEQAVDEDPEDDRNTYYLAREYFYYGMNDKAIPMFERHLSLPRAKWPPERAASMRYLAKMIPEKRTEWLEKAIAEAPGRREPWVDLAKHYYETSQWADCFRAATKALEIKEKPLEYLCEAEAWGSAPYDYAAISAYRLGMKDQAVMYGTTACELSPSDQRLKTNLEWYQGE